MRVVKLHFSSPMKFGNVIPIYTSDLLQHSSCWGKPLVRNTTNQCNKDYATSAQKLLNQNNNHMMTKAETTEWCRCDNMIQLSKTFHLSIIAINYAKCVKTLWITKNVFPCDNQSRAIGFYCLKPDSWMNIDSLRCSLDSDFTRS